MVPSLSVAHLVILTRAGCTWRRRRDRPVLLSVAVLGLMLVGLAFKRNLLSPLPVWALAILAVPAAATVIGSGWVAARWVRAHPRRDPIPRPLRLSLLVASQVLLFLSGLYLGRITTPVPSPFDLLPSALGSLPAEEVERRVRQDLARLRTVAKGVDDLLVRSARDVEQLSARLVEEGREYFRPSEDDRIRSLLVSYLSYRSALLRMIAVYAGFDSVRDPDLKARCFLLGYAAAATCFESSLALVRSVEDLPLARRKLNEPDAAWGIRAGMFDRIQEGVSSDRNAELFEEFAQYLDRRRASWRRAEVYPEADLRWLEERIDRCTARVRALAVDRSAVWLERIVRRVQQDAYSPVYGVQSLVSCLIGDVRLASRPPFVTPEQIRAVESRLEPGDILIERRNWFLSNAFLPGFWPHAALYVGRAEDLERMGVSKDPAVRARWEDYTTAGHDGRPHTVIESVSEGVIFNSLDHSIHADYVAVLRPRVSREDRARAIVRAFRHQGKPYDFEFDFFSSDKLVCTELVYRAYEGILHFDLIRIMGRDTLPALEIVKKFRRERGTPGAELDFVLFLDTKRGAGRAHLAGPDALCRSVDRPQAFND